jgi:hypothetical protein
VPGGYGAPIVSCWRHIGDGALAYETAPEFVEVGGQNEYGIAVELQAGTTWNCDWFNVPVSDQGDGDGAATAIDDSCEGKHASALHGAFCGASDTNGTPETGNPGGAFATDAFLPATWPVAAPAEPAAQLAA